MEDGVERMMVIRQVLKLEWARGNDQEVSDEVNREDGGRYSLTTWFLSLGDFEE